MENYLKRMSNIGILESDSAEEKFKIKILNQIGSCSIWVMQFMLLSDIYKRDIFQICIDLFLIFLVLIIVLLNFYKKHTASRLYFTYFLSLMSMIIMIIYGNQIKFEFIFFLFAMTAIVFFDKKSTIYITFIYIMILFIIQKTFLQIHDFIIKFELSFVDQMIPFFSFFIVTFVILNSFKDQFTSKENELLGLLSENEIKNIKLQNANSELERFAHIASHDLKSPLRTVVSFLNLIERKIEKKEYESVGEYIQFAKKGGQQMNQLVDDILQFSTIKSDTEIPTEIVDLNEIFATVEQQFLGFLSDNKGKLISSKLPTITVNKLLISILFQNLIENGLKYNNNPFPKVTVECIDNQSSFELNFIDNGIGIASDYHEKIFNLFTRLHANDVYQGTGLGLSICKKIVEQMGATISVKSELGKGATFSVLFNKSQ